ncbi:unnamed protein product [Camellia sinensis]
MRFQRRRYSLMSPSWQSSRVVKRQCLALNANGLKLNISLVENDFRDFLKQRTGMEANYSFEPNICCCELSMQ